MKKLTLLAATSLFFFSSAYAYENLYMNVSAGLMNPWRKSNYTVNSDAVTYAPTQQGNSRFMLTDVNWINRYTPGYDLSVAVGANVRPNWRAEGEFLLQGFTRRIKGTYNWQEINALAGHVYAPQYGNSLGSQSNQAYLYSLFANAYYDAINRTDWTPFLGVGVGVAWLVSGSTSANGFLQLNDLTDSTTTRARVTANSGTLAGTAFAGQFKAGFNYKLNQSFSVGLQYRLLITTNFRNDASSVVMNPNTPTPTVFGIPAANIVGLANNGFDVNIRYTF